jgi:hypothetical protein
MGGSGQEPGFRGARAELDPRGRLDRGFCLFGELGQLQTDGNTRTPEIGANQGLNGSRTPVRSPWQRKWVRAGVAVHRLASTVTRMALWSNRLGKAFDVIYP